MQTLAQATEIKGREESEVELGSFAPSDSKAAGSDRLVIATFNIRYGVGSFLISGSLCRRLGLKWHGRRSRLISKHLQRASRAFVDGALLPGVDVLALQEADKKTLRAGGQHIALELARELRMHYAHASISIPRDEEPKAKRWYLDFEEHIEQNDAGDTGIAFLSRLPFQEVLRVDLPFAECAWRPRLALNAKIPVGSSVFNLFNAHIDPHASIDEQLEQHRAILALAEKEIGPKILLGDFNTLSKRSCLAMRELLESQDYTTPFPTGTATWRAGLIRLHTDWIFVRGARVVRSGVARPLGVSDHWPVWAEIMVDESVGA